MPGIAKIGRMKQSTADRADAPNSRYDREKWLEAALEILSSEGSARLTVRHLAESLGVTTGSFYWHFKDRDDFIRGIVEYWMERCTASVARQIAEASLNPSDQLLRLMQIITDEDVGIYDVPIRAWAAHNPKVARAVGEVDQIRYGAVRGIFAAMGFEDPELDMRTRTFVVYHSMEAGFYAKLPKEERLKAIEGRHAWFTRPAV